MFSLNFSGLILHPGNTADFPCGQDKSSFVTARIAIVNFRMRREAEPGSRSAADRDGRRASQA